MPTRIQNENSANSDSRDWTFGGTWPYAPRYFDHPDGRLHYVDEGPPEAPPVVMVHGNPTWGYLYRRFIEAVVDAGYRAIVPDHLGFGRSDKPDQAELYEVPRHADRLDALLESLDLSDTTLVVQDWGGPIGLAWAARHPERVGALVILNTFCHRPPEDVPLPLPLKLFRTPGVGEVMVKGFNAFTRLFLFGEGTVHSERLGENERAAYLAPHPTWASRTGALVFPREIPDGPTGRVAEFAGDVHDALLPAFRDKPVLIAWPMKDTAFTPDMLTDLWIPDFPHAEVLRVEDAGHYIQEDAHETLIPRLLSFLDGQHVRSV